MKNKLVYSLIVIILGLTAFIAALVSYSDSLLTEWINRELKKEVKSESRIQNAHLSVMKGTISVQNFEIKNTERFTKEYFIQLKNIYADVSLGELLERKIDINILELNDLNINIEKKDLVKNYENIFLKNREMVEKRNNERGAQKPVMIIIRKIKMSDITLFAPLLADNKPVKIEKLDLIGPWNLTNMSGIDVIFERIIESLENEASNFGLRYPGKVKNGVEEDVDQIKELFG